MASRLAYRITELICGSVSGEDLRDAERRIPGGDSSAREARSRHVRVQGRDQGGAVVVGAIVEVENTGTSARRSAVSDQEGAYTVPNLEPGPYKISITAPGFRVSQYSVELLARQTVRIDGAMYVSSQAAVVDVVDAAPVVNSDVSLHCRDKDRTRAQRTADSNPTIVMSILESGDTCPGR